MTNDRARTSGVSQKSEMNRRIWNYPPPPKKKKKSRKKSQVSDKKKEKKLIDLLNLKRIFEKVSAEIHRIYLFIIIEIIFSSSIKTPINAEKLANYSYRKSLRKNFDCPTFSLSYQK